jgi:hypothetical protein
VFNPGQVNRVDVTADRLGTQGHNVAQDQAEKTVQLPPVGRVAVRIATDNATARAGLPGQALHYVAIDLHHRKVCAFLATN